MTDRLSPGQELKVGEHLDSPNRCYSLDMQGDGNLVLYRHDGTTVTPMWASGTAEWNAQKRGITVVAPFMCAMQGDGNLVLYDAIGQAYWASDTFGSGTSLVLHDDGSLVLEGPPQPSEVVLSPADPNPPVPPATPSAPPVDPPKGPIVLVNGAVCDARGPFNPIGVSFFPVAWAWKNDRDRLWQNAELLADGAVDYQRMFGQVAGGPWEDRTVNPDWPDYEAVMAASIDGLFDDYGIRSQVTVFASAGEAGAETPARRRRVVDQTLSYIRGREHKLIMLEVANEAVGFGADGIPEMQELARQLARGTDVPVSITSISNSNPELYLGMRPWADLATVHYERDISKADGYDRPTRQPWGYPGEYYPPTVDASTAPQQGVDNEGIGPYSSVAEDRDPLRNITRRVVAWIAKNPMSLWHCGPGIYFGGKGAQKSGSPANFWQVPETEPTLKGFNVLRRLVPQGIASWTRTNSGWAEYPWVMQTGVGEGMFQSGVGCVRAYAVNNWEQVVCVPFGIKDHVLLGEKRKMTWQVFSLLDGHLIQEGTGPLRIEQAQGEAQLIIGKFV